MDERLHLIERARFGTAQTGYVPTAVHRLLGELRTAIREGEPVGPIIARADLGQGTFGYDAAQVEDLLNQLVVLEAGDVLPPAEAEPTPTPEPTSTSSLHDTDVVAEGPAAPEVDRGMLIDAVNRVRFRMARRREWGYEPGEVDNFLDRVLVALEEGRSLDFVREARFPMTRRGGYSVGDVDVFLDQLEGGRPAGSDPVADDGVMGKLRGFLGV